MWRVVRNGRNGLESGFLRGLNRIKSLRRRGIAPDNLELFALFELELGELDWPAPQTIGETICGSHAILDRGLLSSGPGIWRILGVVEELGSLRELGCVVVEESDH
jgi:hypothetical protein